MFALSVINIKLFSCLKMILPYAICASVIHKLSLLKKNVKKQID